MNTTVKSLYIALFSITLAMNNYILPMEVQKIPNASYYIYENANPNSPIGYSPGKAEPVIFYTFDGDEITVNEHLSNFILPHKMLDPNAPKPQSCTYQITWWSGLSIIHQELIGIPGWFICFYDKNGNQIASYRCDKNTFEISDFSEKFPIDLSNVKNTTTQELEEKQNSGTWCIIS